MGRERRCREMKEEKSIPRDQKSQIKQNIGNRREKTNKQNNRQNRKRTGNPLINANHTWQPVLVSIYSTPHTDPGMPLEWTAYCPLLLQLLFMASLSCRCSHCSTYFPGLCASGINQDTQHSNKGLLRTWCCTPQ